MSRLAVILLFIVMVGVPLAADCDTDTPASTTAERCGTVKGSTVKLNWNPGHSFQCYWYKVNGSFPRALNGSLNPFVNMSAGRTITLGINPNFYGPEHSGTMTLYAKGNNKYTNHANNPCDENQSQIKVQTLVNLNSDTPPPPPKKPTASISASPSTIQTGQSSTLTWSTSNATSVVIDMGIGTVNTSGSESVSPSSSTTYTLTATGPGGTDTAATTVTVNDPTPTPPPVDNDPPVPPNPPQNPPGGGGGGGGNDDDDSGGGGSGPVNRGRSGSLSCENPEAGTLVWRWVRDEQEETILQLEASTRGKDTEQEISPVLTLFSPAEIPVEHVPIITAGGYRQQVERTGRRNWMIDIDEQHFFVNHFSVQEAFRVYGLDKARTHITLDRYKYRLQRAASKSILTGCGIAYSYPSQCEPEAGTLVWRWIRSEDGEAILQLEASTRGKDSGQEINPVITLFTRSEIPAENSVAVSGFGSRRLNSEQFGERNWTRVIDGVEYFVNHFKTSPKYPPGHFLGSYDLSQLGARINIDEWEFNLQRPVSTSVITGCR